MIGTNAVYSGGSTATLQAGPSNSVTVNSGNAGATPGVSINGVVGTGSASHTGVLITGSGQNGESYTKGSGATPTWADVAIQSKSYGAGDPTLGSAILVTDYGVQIISPQPGSGEKITNNTGVNNSSGIIVNNNGLNTADGSVENNMGGNSGSGSATNNIGINSGSGTVENAFGNNAIGSTGDASNTIGQNNGSGSMTNSFGGGSGDSTNNIGTGTGISTNTIGSTTIGSSNTLQAGNTTSYMANGVLTSSVAAGGGVGDSVLRRATTTTSGNSGIVLKDANASYVAVDHNGKLSNNDGVVPQTSASMTITNGYGNTHGFYVDERQATISGGTRSSSLTLNDYGARFSNSATGAPITVTGVADGRSDFDAVNVRQYSQAISAAAAAANIPNIEPGKSASFGIGMGHFMGSSALAIGGHLRVAPNALIKASISSGLGSGRKTIVGMGAGWSW